MSYRIFYVFSIYLFYLFCIFSDFEQEIESIYKHLEIRKVDGEKKMEAEYVGYYLGSAILTKGTTGLGVIQKPLRDKYFAFRKSPDNKLGPEVGIRINPRGILLLFPGTHPGEPNDEFYELEAIHFIEAVSFVVDKQKDKKMYGAFLPIDFPPDPAQDKLFVQLEKKFNHLTKIQHPPMLACVMRRPTGVRAIDCHMFVIPVKQDAIQIVEMVHRFQQRPVPPEYYDRPPPSRLDRPEPDVIPRNLGPSVDPRKRQSAEDYEIYRGRGVELRQEHFLGGGARPSDLGLENQERSIDSDRGPPSSRGGYERNSMEDPRDFRRMQGSPSPRFENRDFQSDRRSREYVNPNGVSIERDSVGREYEFDNRIAHDRQRSGGGNSLERFDMDRYGGMSPRNEYVDRSMEYGGGRLNRSGERTPDTGRVPPSSWQDQRQMGRNSGREFDDGGYPRPFRGDGQRSPTRGRSPPRGYSPPRGHSSPRSPRARSPEPNDQIFSASNLESRLEESHGKPVAKVPPNRHAGVRVLPSLPIPGAKSQLKPVTPKAADAPSKIDDKPPSYDFNPKIDSEDVNPYDNAPENKLYRQNRVQSERSPDVQRRDYSGRSELGSKVKSADYSYTRNDNRRENDAYRGNPKPWSYEEEKEKFLRNRDWNSGYKSKSAHEISDDRNSGQGGFGQGQNMKDLEIADMFSNLRTSNAARGDVDFESSLGYLP